MTTKRIAIQGYPGAFHEIASNHYHRGLNTNIVSVDTFDRLVEMVETGDHVDRGLMAIENTIAGSLLSNYQLLNHANVHITGEVFLRIQLTNCAHYEFIFWLLNFIFDPFVICFS